MRTLRLSLTGTVILALLGGSGGVVVAQESEEVAFPTGTFVSVENPSWRYDWYADGTGSGRSYDVRASWSFTYATNGDLYTEMTHDYLGNRQVPATYHWAYDGEQLTFELWGEDLVGWRNTRYSLTWRWVEDPREVLVAAQDIPAGYAVLVKPIVVSAAEVGPDALTDVAEALEYVTAVDVHAGQLITADLVEPR